VTITTNDSAILRFSVATNLVSETNGTLTLTVNRTGTTNNAVTVNFTSTNVPASAGSDYTAANGTFSFAPGETTNTKTIALTDDLLYEGSETFRVVPPGRKGPVNGIHDMSIPLTDPRHYDDSGIGRSLY
jgi:hypothetical protein